ncbi:MAG: sugar ABC transporter permease [Clostridia bacterium]|nr:sugar ABC transporter permease [Clostridia bacterium]
MLQPVSADVTRGRKKAKIIKEIKANAVGYALLLPLLVGLTVFTLYPLIVSLINSFYLNYDGFAPRSEFLFGWGNYKRAFSGYESTVFFQSVKITFLYAIVMVPLGMVLSFGVALLLNRNSKSIGVFRLIYYLPCLIPGIVNTIIWRYAFNSSYGLFNLVLTRLGFSPSLFFESPNAKAVVTFAFMNLFGVGGSMLMWLAGLKSIPAAYYEAAKIEGSGFFRMLFFITVPLMTPYIFYQLITNVIGTLQICDAVYMISSSGGVNNNLLFYGLYIFRNFQNVNYGYAAALAYMLFLVIAALSTVLFRFNKFVYYEGD